MVIAFTQHARTVTRERRIRAAWIRRAVEHPERLESADDGTVHYLVTAREHDRRWLRVVCRSEGQGVRAITAFSTGASVGAQDESHCEPPRRCSIVSPRRHG